MKGLETMDTANNIEGYYSYAEVDLGRIRQNLENMQAECDKRIIPVTKGNAWGQGLIPVVSMLFDKAGYDITAVAQVTEGIKIREAGYTSQTVMILSGVPLHAIPYVVKYNLLMEVYNTETVAALSRAVKEAGLKSFPVQLKLDTGLHRIGVSPDNADKVVEAIDSAGNLEIVGIMTHYTEGSDEKIQSQYELFKETVQRYQRAGRKFRYISAGCSTNVNFPKDDISTHIRLGWGYIAYVDDIGYDYFFNNKPSLTVRTFITNIAELKAGDTVGYTDAVLQKDTKAACISMGYCDGLYKPMTQHGGPLLIRGKHAHYIDAGMDQTIIDVTGIDCHIGDEVTIFGKDKYSDMYLGKKEVADYSDGACSILQLYLSDRVKRVYVDRYDILREIQCMEDISIRTRTNRIIRKMVG